MEIAEGEPRGVTLRPHSLLVMMTVFGKLIISSSDFKCWSEVITGDCNFVRYSGKDGMQ